MARLRWCRFPSSFPRSGGDAGEAGEVRCSRIFRFGGWWCSGSAHRGEGGGRLLELLSLVLFFVAACLLLVKLWRCWGWCGVVASAPRRLYRRCPGSFPSPAGRGGEGRRGWVWAFCVFSWCWRWSWLLGSPAGRGGEGGRGAPACWCCSEDAVAERPEVGCRGQEEGRLQVRARRGCWWWPVLGLEEGAAWPCSFIVHDSVACGGWFLRSTTLLKVERFHAEMNGHTHVAMEWKDTNPECLLPSFLTDPFPPADPLVEDCTGNHDVGFERRGLSVDVGSPQEEGKPMPVTPQFGQRSGSSSSLSERMQARAGYSVPKLSMPCVAPAAADSEHSGGAQSPYLTIPPGLSPASLLESPVFLSNAMGQASPTTGKLFMLGDNDNNNLTRLEATSIEDSPATFCFKPLDLKSSQYAAERNKELLPNHQHPSLPSRDVPVKTETNIQTARDVNSLGHLNQAQFNNVQELMKSSYHDSNNKRNRLAPDRTIPGGDNNASPPDHGPPAADSEAANADYPAVATATPAEDGYSWRKYGQKQVKHSEYPRSYYKCTYPNCQVKKKVERSHEGHVTEIIYKGSHDHPMPAAQGRRPVGIPQAVHPFGDAQMDPAADNNHNNNGNAGAPNAEARPLWHNGVGVQDWRADGLEATSSPSVPGELCDSSASMQVHDGATRFESPEGVDVTSAVSDEVDGDDRVAHGNGSMSLVQSAAVEAEEDELESKRRKLESCAIEMSTASRAIREPRIVIQTTSEIDILDDGYRWRKYGQKVVKGNPNPRSYYKCTHPGCSVRKHVERASHDLKSVITTYEGKHNHEVPAARNGGHGSSAAAASGASQLVHARRTEAPSVQDGLMRLGGCGAPFGLPPRDPLGPMSNFPYSLGGHGAALPSLPMPTGLGAVEGLKLPMLSPSLHPLFRHRQPMETAGFRVPKGEVKDETVPNNVAGGGGAAYQQIMSRLPMGHRM